MGIPLRRGIVIPIGIAILRNDMQPNKKKIVISYQMSIPRTKRALKSLMKDKLSQNHCQITVSSHEPQGNSSITFIRC